MAPGMAIEHKGKYLMMLPGPPRELYPMFTTYGLPHLLSLISDQYVVHSKVLRFFGIGESALEEELMDLIDAQSNPTIAPLAKEGEVTLRLTAKAKHISEAEEMIQVIEQKIEGRVGEFIYGYDDDSLESVLVRELIGQKKTVAFAESITGGLVSHMVTSVPGSSAMLKGSIVCYTNDVKHHLLAVPKDILTQAGAVSEETAHILAEEVRLRLGSTYGVSITGEAGPVASEDKPVGLVYIGVADGTQTQVKTFRLSGQRSAIQSRAAKHAIFTMLERIKKGGF
jgi:nicotinamide-nucleotide amidase